MTHKTIPLSDNLKNCLARVEGAIAPDIPSEWSGANVVECCIDANRMTMFCGNKGKEADAEVSRLIKEHGYPAVLETLAPLVSV